MIFVFSKWDFFCRNLAKKNILSVRISDILNHTSKQPFLVLKHDVETNVRNAFILASIESKYGHRGTYYVQANLLNNKKNILLLKKMKKMNHEISYHHDVMDSNKGDIVKAIVEFEQKKKTFENNGFSFTSVCQHGNPVMERIGYTSNRDFFRSERVRSTYPQICDVMVNFKEMASTNYNYYSDATKKIQLIFDPLFNDVINSEDNNVLYNDLVDLLNNGLIEENNSIISIHPHRWAKSKISYYFNDCIFNCVRKIAKLLIKVPFIKKIMSKYYYLAKKI